MDYEPLGTITKAQKQLREALAEPAQQPVAIVHINKLKFNDVHINNHEWIEWKQPKYDGMRLFLAPTMGSLVALTDREAEAAFDRGGNELCLKLRAVIAAYREKNSC